ncbi:MAG TPA: family 78 glycoside hydrolase catalytic domain [Planctomycetota bacterium]|nr:family 78 glycoside hydrolase catalytic domain [Planctomycetota bacterium]
MAAKHRPSLAPAYLRCEYRLDPMGIGETQPRLSWLLESKQRGQRQTAYRILVASSPQLLRRNHGDLWDSGQVASDDTTAIVYSGKPLASGLRCHWKVKVWDKDGTPSPWSRPALWSMGLLEQADWRADWIGYDAPRALPDGQTGPRQSEPANLILPPPVHLRTAFQVTKKVKQATLYATAFGWFDAHLNGRRVNHTCFDPGWTDYTKRVYARAYDVTKLLRQGQNALGAILADGWFSGHIGWQRFRDNYGRRPRFRAQLHIEYADGTSDAVATSPAWRAATGPTLEADILMGETHDARKAMPNWAKPGFDDSSWAAVDTGAELSPLVQPHPGPPVIAIEEFRAERIAQPTPGAWVLDMGRNFAGVPRLTVKGRPGQKITLRFAERLNPDGTLYTTNLRTARATDTYICRGRGVEVWQPRFTFHGFQFIEVTGLERKPTKDTVIGVALSSDTPVAGSFLCSDPMLNQLHTNIYWTQRANFIEVPTDCPQRDERLGWMGDAQVYIRAAALNADVQAFFTKWLIDLDDAQRADGQFPMVAPLKVAGDDGGPAWADAGVICPWTLYEVYGDRRILERHYDAMARFVEFSRARCTPDLLPPEKFHCFGDWSSINADTPKDVILTAYFAHSTDLLARAAEALGRADDAAKHRHLFEGIKAAFNKAFVAPDGRIKGDTQCAYVLAIAYGLLDPNVEKLAAKHLVADIKARGWRLSTGFVGTKDLMLALAKIGRNDVAYRLIQSDKFPGWGFSIKHGATSIWERWDGWTPEKGFQDPGMNSFAHYAFGAVYQWMVENIGGIRLVRSGLIEGFPPFTIEPQPGGTLTEARVGYRSIRGPIETHWKLARGKLVLDVTIPPNSSATVVIPSRKPSGVTESGKPIARAEGVRLIRTERTCAIVEVASGRYRFAASR